eukprot:NODE_544_length_1586_cov_77.538061_g394_i0.p1 GENE.NODE_544_length_1586_cov_77.538061_g394_i0~~NODE_544_length_1586_cov_77.538061_g394_i0.p1  ORF type:complete len:373 (-),score=77.76 NODE_544_length_1586_cov_77.538061_g394_i0:316-1434(-)
MFQIRKTDLDTVTSIAHNAAKQTAVESEETFEGVEKRLDIDVRPRSDCPNGLRNISSEFWAGVVGKLNAKILDQASTEEMDGYILSESSLFVSPVRCVLLTCGTTVLLECLENLINGLVEHGFVVEWMQYSRKNFTYPWLQEGPHCSLAEEYEVLHKHVPGGSPFIFGPLNGDHFYLYMFDDIQRDQGIEETDQLCQILMYGISEDMAKLLVSPKDTLNSPETHQVRTATGLEKLFADHELNTVQDIIFEPYGYSVNALRGTFYATSHITPQAVCSYASFETNLELASYQPLISQVIGIYKPERFTVVLFIDEQSNAGKARTSGLNVGVEDVYEQHSMQNLSMNAFEPGYVTLNANFIATPSPRRRRSPVPP